MDGGLTAIGGFLFQTLGTLSLKASSFQEYRDAPQHNDDLEAVFGFAKEGELHYETEDQDAAIKEALHGDLPGYILIQFKYCSLLKRELITRYDLQKIIDRLNVSAEKVRSRGYQVTGYSLLTNRSLNADAEKLVEKFAKNSSIPFHIAQSLPERYWETRLQQFARRFSCTDTEVTHGIRGGIGDLLQKTANPRFFGEPIITKELLVEAFTGRQDTHPLTPNAVAEKSCQRLDKLFSQPFHLGSSPFVLRSSIQKQLSSLVEQHAFIVLSGTGGNGKTTVLWQWLKDCLSTQLPQQRGIYYHLDAANKVQSDFFATCFCHWTHVPTTHRWRDVNTPEQIIDRLEISRHASMELSLDHHLIFVLALDAVDEAFRKPDKGALKELLMWFWEQETTQPTMHPRASLIITCRDTKELARDWLQILSPFEKTSEVFREIEVKVDAFTPDELVTAARQHLPAFAHRFEKARSVLDISFPLRVSGPGRASDISSFPGLGTRAIQIEDSSVFQAEDTVVEAVQTEIFQALYHPTLWQCLLKIDPPWLSRVLDGENAALDHLAALFVQWFCAKRAARGNQEDESEIKRVLKELARQCCADGGTRYQKQDWITYASGTTFMTHIQANFFYKEAVSAGLIVHEVDGWWRWRHSFIGRYLIQSPLDEED